MPLGDLLPELVLLVAAVTIVVTALLMPRERQAIAAVVAIGALIGSAATIVPQLSAPVRLTFSGVWALDDATAAAKLLIVVATAAAAAMTPDWLKRDRRHGEYYAMLLLSALGAMAMAAAADTMQLVIGILLASVTGYVLAAYHRAWPLSVEAGMKFFLIGALTNSLLVVGIVWLFGFLGTTDYAAMTEALRASGLGQWMIVPLVLVVVGITFKLGAVPAHAWMPDVAEGAPAPAAAFLTVVPKIGAAIAMARFLQVFDETAIDWRGMIAAVAVATMTLGNLAALWQGDLRRLLGWSSVSQSGYALVAVAVLGLSPFALPALMFFLLGYAIANMAAFAVVTELRGRTDIAAFRGLAGQYPIAATVLALSLLSLTGIPPLAGFFGKFSLFAAAIDAGYAWLAVAVVANTVISLFYYLRVIGPMYLDGHAGRVAALGAWSRWTMLATGLAIIVVGLGAEVAYEVLRPIRLLP